MEHRRSNIFIRGKKKVYSRLLPVLAAICVCSFPVSAVYASDAADAAETDMTNTDAQTPEAEDVNLQMINLAMVGVEVAQEVIPNHILRLTLAAEGIRNKFQVFV